MPIVNPTQWLISGLHGGHGVGPVRMRVTRDDGSTYNFTNEDAPDYEAPYAVLENHPDDAIILDRATNSKNIVFSEYGGLEYLAFDQDGDKVPIGFDWTWRDNFKFSGKINGVATGLLDLSTENTSIIPHIFNDINATYYIHLERKDADGNYTIIEYSGTVKYNEVTGTPYRQKGSFTSSQSKLSKKAFKSRTAFAQGQEKFIRDMLRKINQSHLASSTPEAFMAGLFIGYDGKVPGLDVNILEVLHYLDQKLPPTKAVPFGKGAGVFFMHAYPRTNEHGYASGAPTLQVFVGTNRFGVKHGFNGISRISMLNKAARTMGAVFDEEGSDIPFISYEPDYSEITIDSKPSDKYDLVPFQNFSSGKSNYLSEVIQYNVRFGVKPTEPIFEPTSVLNPYFHMLDVLPTPSAASGTPDVITIPNHGLYDGMSVWLFKPADVTGDYIPGNSEFYRITIIDDNTFSLDGTNGSETLVFDTDARYYIYTEAAYQFSSPSTYSPSDTVTKLFANEAIECGCRIVHDIIQSGSDIGRPLLTFLPLETTDGDAPAGWNERTLIKGSQEDITTLAKTAVSFKYKGDDTTLYCPKKPDSDEEVIPFEVYGRSKKWGGANGIYGSSDFLPNANKKWNEQFDTQFHWGDAGKKQTAYLMYLTPEGYLPGSYTYMPKAFKRRYSNNFDDYQLGADTNDNGGHSALSYELHRDAPNYVLASAPNPIKENEYNRLWWKAIQAANVYVRNTQIEKHKFRSVLADDGTLRGNLKCFKKQWRDEKGNNTWNKSHRVFVMPFGSDNYTEVDFISMRDSSGTLEELDVIIVRGDTQTSTSLGGTVGSGGSGNTLDDTAAVQNLPASTTRNDITAAPEVLSAINAKKGSLGLNWFDVTCVNGANPDLDCLDATTGNPYPQVNLTGPTASYNITGLANGNFNGQMLQLRNSTAYPCTLKDTDSGSVAANQIKTPTGSDYILAAGGTITLSYKSDDALWIIEVNPISATGDPGWTDIPVVDGNNNDLDIGTDFTSIRLNDGGLTDDFNVTGFTGGNTNRQITVWNNTPFYCRLSNETTSIAANQITADSVLDIGLTSIAPLGWVVLRYDDVSSLWKVSNVYPEPAPIITGTAVSGPSEDANGHLIYTIDKDLPTSTVYDPVDGSNDNVDVPYTQTQFEDNGGLTGDFILSGIVAPVSPYSGGVRQVIWNNTSYSMTVKHDATSSAANRFFTNTGSDITIAPGESLKIIYDNNVSRWIVENDSGSSNSLPDSYIYVGDTSNVPQAVPVSGDLILDHTGDFELVFTGVTPGTYGSATAVGVFAVDAKGRITAAANVTITHPSSLPPSGPAGGDLSGTYPNPAVAKINGATLGSTTATSGNILVASGTSTWVSVAMAGDVTISNAGVTAIGAGKVQYSMIQNVGATKLLGNSTGSPAPPQDITLGTNLSFAGSTLNATTATVVTSKGGSIVNLTGISGAVSIVIWRATVACTVTNVRGYRKGGSGATINALRNGSSTHLASDKSLTSADTWMDGGTVQNTAYSVGDSMAISVVTATGLPTEIDIQIDITIP